MRTRVLPRDAQAWLRHQRARHAAQQLVVALDQARIPTLLVKGIILAPELYGDIGERPISDVDVLVRPRDFLNVVAVARRGGWSRIWDSKVPGVVNLRIADTFCDVSAYLGPIGTSALGVDDLLARAEWTDRDLGFWHARPELHDHALLMSIDVFKDKFAWAKPHAREDLVRLAMHPDFDPAALVGRARQAQLATLLALVADWILAGGADERWSLVRRQLENGRIRRKYAARYLALASQRTESYPWRAALAARMVSDTAWRRLAAPLLGAAGVLFYLGAGHRLTTPPQ